MRLIDLKIPLNKLLLDPNNYRLDYLDNSRERADYSDEEVEDAQADTMRRLEKEKLGELRESIRRNGFLEMDRIVVRRLKVPSIKDQFLVVEGNRRAAAFKGLIEDYYSGYIELSDDLVNKAKSISVICVEGNDSEIKEFSAGLMGVRHVSGPKRWTGYQSARLIYERHNENESFEKIGALLGINEIEAERRFRNYSAFLQMKEDENYGSKILQKHYTLLSEFLSPSRFARDWLAWSEENYKFTNQENLNRVYSAITSSDGKGAEITNVTKAREFISYLESSKHRAMIEAGMRLEDLPPLHDDSSKRVKLLKDFLSYLESIEYLDIIEEEDELLREITAQLNSLDQNT